MAALPAMDWLAANASLVLTASALLAYMLTLLWKRARPALALDVADTPERWAGNFGLLALNHGVPYLVVPLVAALAAGWAQALGLGLLPAWDAPWALSLVVGLLAVDLKGWALHWALHRYGWLWRVHQVHHSDLRFDAALSFRFHPVEAALASLASGAIVVARGLPVDVVLLIGVVGAVHNVFVHANARPGPRGAAALRRVLVTPDLHRVHHSASAEDARHNYGIVFSFWDRLFRSWRAPAGAGPRRFGLDAEPDPARLSLPRLLRMPLRRPASDRVRPQGGK